MATNARVGITEPQDAELERFNTLDGLVEALQDLNGGGGERRGIFARGENVRHIRHAQILARWPVLGEAWARRVDQARLDAVDRTPGAATFGR